MYDADVVRGANDAAGSLHHLLHAHGRCRMCLRLFDVVGLDDFLSTGHLLITFGGLAPDAPNACFRRVWALRRRQMLILVAFESSGRPKYQPEILHPDPLRGRKGFLQKNRKKGTTQF